MLLPLLLNLGMFGEAAAEAETVAGLPGRYRNWILPNGMRFRGTRKEAEAFFASLDIPSEVVAEADERTPDAEPVRIDPSRIAKARKRLADGAARLESEQAEYERLLLIEDLKRARDLKLRNEEAALIAILTLI